MILYVNGDSHTAAAEAVNTHAFAEDDSQYFFMGRAPHPSNLAASWSKRLSNFIKAGLKCDAESASSNTRIIRTTREWIANNTKLAEEALVIIQWSTWEREEWLIDGTYYQINASGIDDVPLSHQQKYKEFISSVDWNKTTSGAHNTIWAFHKELKKQNITHIFFNGNNHFESIKNQHDWGNSYIGPYDPKLTYNQWLLDQGFDTVSPKSWHFGQEAHAAWSRFVLQYIIKHNLVK